MKEIKVDFHQQKHHIIVNSKTKHAGVIVSRSLYDYSMTNYLTGDENWNGNDRATNLNVKSISFDKSQPICINTKTNFYLIRICSR